MVKILRTEILNNNSLLTSYTSLTKKSWIAWEGVFKISHGSIFASARYLFSFVLFGTLEMYENK